MSTCAPWATADDLGGPCSGAHFFDDLPVTAADVLQMASDILFGLTRQRWPGECQDYVRPCRRQDGCLNLVQLQAAWDLRMGSISGASAGLFQTGRPHCGCGLTREVELRAPVTEILEVKVDGLVIDPALYRVDDERFLVALGDHFWPVCQVMDLDDDQPRTWSVRYEYGASPPVGGRVAAASLACQLAQAFAGNENCRLPKRVTTITRQGLTVAVLDPLLLFADGLTGLPEVDLWVNSVNRGDKFRRASVIVPDRAPLHRRPPAP